MDLYVIIENHAELNAIEWQQAIDAKALPVRLEQGINLSRLRGFLPVKLNGADAGFYYFPEEFSALAADIPAIKAAHLRKATAYTLSFGGNFLECASAYYSAAALVAQFNGRAFSAEDNRFLTFDELRSGAMECLDAASKQ
jgi:hypothetical protein